MNVTIIENVHTTNFDMAAGKCSVEIIESDAVCSECSCYLEELEADVYFCKKCNVVI